MTIPASNNLYWNTVSGELQDLFRKCMKDPLFDSFRLVGGTALSLHYGHRMSVDIDLFTDTLYESINFEEITKFLTAHYTYVSQIGEGPVGMGRAFLVGKNSENAIKVDIYYNDDFIRNPIEMDGVRLASPDEIAAMKINVVQNIGRKKDFWDLHELMNHYDIKKMLDLHKEKYPYNHDPQAIISNFTNFEKAENDFEPHCLRGKYWELIKLDLFDCIENFRMGH